MSGVLANSLSPCCLSTLGAKRESQHSLIDFTFANVLLSVFCGAMQWKYGPSAMYARTIHQDATLWDNFDKTTPVRVEQIGSAKQGKASASSLHINSRPGHHQQASLHSSHASRRASPSKRQQHCHNSQRGQTTPPPPFRALSRFFHPSFGRSSYLNRAKVELSGDVNHERRHDRPDAGVVEEGDLGRGLEEGVPREGFQGRQRVPLTKTNKKNAQKKAKMVYKSYSPRHLTPCMITLEQIWMCRQLQETDCPWR